MKKSQSNQMFQMLMTLIIVGMVLLLGFQLISGVVLRSSQIDYIQFRRSLLNSLDSVASDYGARQRISLNVPNGAQSLCFVDMQNPYHQTAYPLINSYWGHTEYRTQADQSMVRNVFLIGTDFFASFRVSNLDLQTSNNHICIDVVRSRVEFWAEGRSRSLRIEEI